MSWLLDRFAYRVLPLILALGVLLFLRWSGAGVAGMGPKSTTIALGFLLIGAFIGGKLAVRTGLPRITGYLLVGLLVGPYVSGLLTRDMMAGGKAVEGLAVALIALTAGGEIRVDWVKSQARTLVTITILQILIVGTLVTGVVLVFAPIFPFLPEGDFTQAGVIALVLAAISISGSPTVTIAIISESRAQGPLSRTVLGIVVLIDVCVIVLFATMLAIAKDVLGDGGGDPLALKLTWEIGGSVVIGALFGLGIDLFLRYVNRDVPVFVLAACIAISQLAGVLHLETLIMALTAGFYVQNVSPARGESLIKGVERVSLPVYALFFAAAGAKVNVGALATMGPLAVLLASVRVLGIWLGARLGTRLSSTEPVVRRYAWLGLISQAGVTLALAAILARVFPEWGEELQVVIIAMIALHEMVGPVVFQFALRRAGEIGAAGSPEEDTSPERDGARTPG